MPSRNPLAAARRSAGAAALALLSVTALPGQAERQLTHHLVQVSVVDARTLDRLVALDLDLAACATLEPPLRVVDVIATDADVARLRASGFSFEIAIRNLEDHHARELAKYGPYSPEQLTPPIGQGGMGGHYTLAQMEAILDSFALTHPAFCTPKVSIGKSIEGRDIWMVKISDNVAVKENEPEVYYDALHHAREPLSLTATLQFMDELLTGYGTDRLATFIVNERELYFVPCVNPDGYEYNYQTNPGGGGMWRKNRRRNIDGSYGVDLNRNYATGWTAPNGGSSSTPNSTTYRGTAAFSEPETTAVEQFAASLSFTHVCTTHTYTDILLRPWGWQPGHPANAADYDQLGDWFTIENGIAHGGLSALLYIASGSACDHHHAARGSISWTPELGRSDEGGFWPNPPKQIEISARYQPMLRKMALCAGAYLEIGDVTIREAPGANGNGVVEPGEGGVVDVSVENLGLVAASGPLTASLVAVSAGLSVLSGPATIPAPGRLASSNNSGNPLVFSVSPTFAGAKAKLRVTLQGAGLPVEKEVEFLTALLRPAVDDDFEKDRGFERAPVGTATSGKWELGAPQATSSGGQTIQPGAQHTTGGQLCWVTEARAGSSAGAYDVDSGYTDLLSPIFDLAHLGYAELRFWRWYAESSADDPFEVFVSYDGGQKWTRVLGDQNPTGGWVEYVHELTTPLTAAVQFRARAQDLNASLVEALIDDFEIRGLAPDGSITALGSPRVGTQLRIGMNGEAGAVGTLLVSPLLGTPLTIPGFSGTLQLSPVLIIDAPPTAFGPEGYERFDFDVPNLPALRGAVAHWQMLHVTGTSRTFGNLQSVTLR